MFPLPLTPFEHYYWCDDRSDYPTTFSIEASVSGVPRREVLQRTLDEALARHPLLRARVAANRKTVPVWTEGLARGSVIIDWGADNQPIADANPAWIDLGHSAGLRIWIRTSRDTARALLQFHHACCDALGSLRFLEDWLILYHCAITGASAQELLPPLDPQRLKWRGDYGLTEANYQPNLADAWRTARLWARLLLRQPSVVPGDTAEPSPADSLRDYPGLVSHEVERDTWRGLRQVAADCGATVNDVLLRDLFLVLSNRGRRQDQSRRAVRIAMPTALRSKEDKAMPAANLLGFAFLTRTPRECRAAAALLASIRDETARIKRWRLGLYFLGGLAFASQRPALLRWYLHSDRCMATAVLSNVGRIFARSPLRGRDGKLIAGDVVLEQLRGAPPVRPGTRASFAVVRYAHEIWVTLRSDPRWFSAEEAQRLVDEYGRQLRNSAKAGLNQHPARDPA